MISNQLTTIKGLSNNELTKLGSGKCLNLSSNDNQQFSTIPKLLSINNNSKCDDNVSTLTDDISQLNTNQSTLISWRLCSPSKTLLNEHNPNLILTKQNLSHQIHRSISTSDYIDWTNHQSIPTSTINHQLDAINFLQEYLQNGNRDVLIDLIHEIAEEIHFDQKKTSSSYSARNNNHFHLTPTFNSNLQFSNNKEKKIKKEKSDEKKETKDVKKKDNENDETGNKIPKKKKEKRKKTEETTTTTDSIVPTRTPKSPADTTGVPSFSIPVPQPSGSSTPEPSRVHFPQKTNIQQQLQTDFQNSSSTKSTHPLNMSVQQQLQSLSQMARDGDEILVTLSVNALTQKQQINNNNNNTPYYQPSFQNNPYSQPWNQMMPPSTGIAMPRNVEIVAKGFARVQNEHPQPPVSNPYPQQPMMHAYNQPPYSSFPLSFAPRYPSPCHSNNGPPQTPIGPPIQPIFAPPNMMMSGGFVRPSNFADYTTGMPNYFDDSRNRSHITNGKCDHLCQSSLYQPDFRGRPSPGLTTNPYYSNPISPTNFSAKRSSKHKPKVKSKPSHNPNSESINRTYSSIY